ncbi:hypothetical protein [Nocardia sp. NPDC047648]|uniref:hypothetical protein n=1 Tax=Nocardia sp. NPDC047648 TaxID=3155625 RepID=UPI0033D5CB21
MIRSVESSTNAVAVRDARGLPRTRRRAVQRRAMLKGCAAAIAVPMFATGCDVLDGSAKAVDELAFDPGAFTVETKTVATFERDKKVIYQFYESVVYVAKPVDKTHQSLSVSVPVEIDGASVDASKAPILFTNSVAGYLASAVTSREPDDGDRTRKRPRAGGGLCRRGTRCARP